MNIILSVVAAIILATGIYVGRSVVQEPEYPTFSEQVETEVLSESDEMDVTGEDDTSAITPTETTNNNAEVSVKTDVLVENPSDKNISSSNTLNTFLYPNANITNQTNSTLSLESTDSPEDITDWYKNTINTIGMNVTSFVVTSTNDVVLNKLSAANSEMKIEVTIKNESTSITTIEVIM